MSNSDSNQRVTYNICKICKDNQRLGASIYSHLVIEIDGRYYKYVC